VRQYFIDQETPLPDTIVPIGHVVEDMVIVLLDESGEEVGVGGIGEIAVRSEYLAAGYWRRPELTRERFQPDPEGGACRLYRTGDLGRMLSDGCLEYFGRKDFQAKVRGYTVEIAVVEAALQGLASVREAVVMTREDRPGEPRLVAYLVPAQRSVPTASALRRTLAEELPEYMIPSTFVMLDAVPLNANGKVDRRALPAPGATRPELEMPYCAPQGPVEEGLAAIWADVLGVERVGRDDPFLDLGGHSLHAVRVLARISELFQEEIKLPDFFAAPTVAGLARTVLALERAPGRVAAVARLRRALDKLSPREVTAMLQMRRERQPSGAASERAEE
jgi:acyl carrier protein